MPLTDKQKADKEEELNRQLEALEKDHQNFKQKIDNNISNLNQGSSNLEDNYVEITGEYTKSGGCCCVVM